MANKEVLNWDGVIDNVQAIGDRLDRLAEKIDDEDDIAEFYILTGNLFRMVSMANNLSFIATKEAERMRKSVAVLMVTTLTYGEA